MRIDKCLSCSERLTWMWQGGCLHTTTWSLQLGHFLHIWVWCAGLPPVVATAHQRGACCANNSSICRHASTDCSFGDSGVCLQNIMSCCSYHSPALPAWRQQGWSVSSLRSSKKSKHPLLAAADRSLIGSFLKAADWTWNHRSTMFFLKMKELKSVFDAMWNTRCLKSSRNIIWTMEANNMLTDSNVSKVCWGRLWFRSWGLSAIQLQYDTPSLSQVHCNISGFIK